MALWLLAALTVLARGRCGPTRSGRTAVWGLRAFMVLLAAGTVMNAASPSPWERFLWAPLALVLLVLCLILDRRRGQAAGRRTDALICVENMRIFRGCMGAGAGLDC
jgi:hypothetical protein